jgi:protein-S-isoprenylcysteine O-methyltransferase Ste14
MPNDLITRGERRSTPLGAAVFVGLRALDGFILQRALQVLDPVPDLLNMLGYAAPPLPPAGGAVLTSSDHNLTPFQAVIWAMSIGSAAKQIIWVVYIRKEPMDVGNAILISSYNTLLNSLNTMAFALATVNPTWSERSMYIAVTLYATGILTELISELQRKSFKDNPKNDGKPYAGGLFGLARNINYFGYTIWRSAFALAGGGFIWAGLTCAALSCDFCFRAIPVLNDWCTKRYGEQWQQVKKKVPYVFCPGVY